MAESITCQRGQLPPCAPCTAPFPSRPRWASLPGAAEGSRPGMRDEGCGMLDAGCRMLSRAPAAVPAVAASPWSLQGFVPPGVTRNSSSHTLPAAHLPLLIPTPLPDPPRGSEIAVK